MGRRAKPNKVKTEAKRPLAGKSPTNDEGARVRDFEKRLAEALKLKTEALEREAEGQARETATAEILRVISRSATDVQPVFNTIVRNAVRLSGAVYGLVLRLDGEVIRLVAHQNFTPEQIEDWLRIPRPLAGTTPIARAIRTGIPHRTDDVETAADSALTAEQLAVMRGRGVRSVLIVPMLAPGRSIGAIVLTHRDAAAFSDAHVELLQTFADQAVIAIENVRLFNETKEALDQQTATSEILRVISASPTDVQPVFNTIVANAVRLCGAQFGTLIRFDGHFLHLAAHHKLNPAALEFLTEAYPRPLDTHPLFARAIRERRVLQVADVEAEPDVPSTSVTAGRMLGYRGQIVVPIIGEGVPVGTLSLGRVEPGLFTERQVALLKTFADQAVIAIENVRLFTELQQKNEALTQANAQVTESLEQQTATSEVLKVISRSTFDLQPVLDTLIENAARLCAARRGVILRRDRDSYHGIAFYNASPELVDFVRRHPITPGRHSITARVALERRTIHVADLQADPDYSYARRDVDPIRTELGVPMFRGDELLGVIILYKLEVQPFTATQIELVETFADQAVIAIENVRLFHEIEDKSRQLEAASQHKSEFLANMSHELRTPMNAILGFSEVLAEGMFGDINEKQAEYLRDILESGRHLLSLINDILDLSKIEAGRMELEPTDFDLPSAIDNALTLVRERAGRRGIMLGRAIDERVGTIRADERKVKQVLLNLLSNALKFTPEGGRIDVWAGVTDGMVEVSVADTGVGIAPEDQEAVFEEFRQVGTADKKVEGTGLGLALSRKFIEHHGGRIWVKSQLGQGSTFTFTLPVRRDK
jgi:signal transduction histidine kinase